LQNVQKVSNMLKNVKVVTDTTKTNEPQLLDFVQNTLGATLEAPVLPNPEIPPVQPEKTDEK